MCILVKKGSRIRVSITSKNKVGWELEEGVFVVVVWGVWVIVVVVVVVLGKEVLEGWGGLKGAL